MTRLRHGALRGDLRMPSGLTGGVVDDIRLTGGRTRGGGETLSN